MSHRITEECIACGTCHQECPEKAITDAAGRSVIDTGVCVDCGSCTEVCPVGACLPE